MAYAICESKGHFLTVSLLLHLLPGYNSTKEIDRVFNTKLHAQ